MTPNHDETSSLWWVLLALGLSFPWLIPVHTEPLTTLYSEVAAGLAVVPLAFWSITRHGNHIEIDAAVMGFILCASIPLLQALFGLYLFPTESYLVSFYLIGLAVAMSLARLAETTTPGRLPETIFASLIIASIVSTGLALAQWTHRDWGILLGAIPRGTRTVANVGQPNELSSLLTWGLISLWWAYLHRHIRGLVATFAAATLLIGIASTGSRTGWLGLSIIYCVALLAPNALDRPNQKRVFSLLGLWFLFLLLVWPTATQLINGAEPSSVSARLSTTGLRPKIWSMMIDGIFHRPWFGYGWNQGRMVQLLELPNHADINVGVQHAHNLLLDLMVWNGLPLGLAIVASLCTWFYWQFRRVQSVTQIMLLLTLVTFLIHTMLELPHCKSFFLVPVAMIMGVLNTQSSLPGLLQIPRLITVPVAALTTTCLLLTWVEYRLIEQDIQTYRITSARIRSLNPSPPPNIFILHGLQSALVSLRTEPREKMPADELEKLRLASTRYPTESALFRYAKAAFLNNRPEEVEISLSRLCQLFGKKRCDIMKPAWARFLDEHPGITPVMFPYYPLN